MLRTAATRVGRPLVGAATAASAAAARSAGPARTAAARAMASTAAATGTASRWRLAAAAAAAVAAAASTAAAAVAACQAPSGSVTDAVSGLSLPTALQPNPATGASAEQALVGFGTRTVTFLGFHVYTAGIYMDLAQLRKLQQRHPQALGVPAGASEVNIAEPAFRDAVFDAAQPVDRSLYITPCRQAAQSHLRDGFGRALESRAGRQQHLDEQRKAAIRQEIQNFKQLFPKGDLNLGDVLLISVTGGSRISFSVNGQLQGSLDSAFIGRTLFEAYMDEAPVSTNTFANLKQGFAARLAG